MGSSTCKEEVVSNHVSVHDADKPMLFHPTVERAMCIFEQRSPDKAVRTVSALKIILQGIHQSVWPEMAWEFSTLTSGGFPLEFTFSSKDENIRYAAEVAGPEIAEIKRLLLAVRILELLGARPLSEAIMAALIRIQSSGKLKYGAWIGGRHTSHSDSYKLYAEITENNSTAANGLVKQFLGNAPLLSRKQPELVMLGYEPRSARVEFYFRVNGLEPWEVGTLLRREQLESQQAELLEMIGLFYGRQIKDRLPGGKWVGFSYSVSPEGGSPVFSIFTYAGSLCGSDKNIRCKVLELAYKEAWDFANYEQISEPLASRNTWMTYHTMMTFSVMAGRKPFFSIGLRPPGYQATYDGHIYDNNICH